MKIRRKILKQVLENYRFCRNSGNDAFGKRLGVILFASLWRIAYENRYETRPLGTRRPTERPVEGIFYKRLGPNKLPGPFKRLVWIGGYLNKRKKVNNFETNFVIFEKNLLD